MILRIKPPQLRYSRFLNSLLDNLPTHQKLTSPYIVAQPQSIRWLTGNVLVGLVAHRNLSSITDFHGQSDKPTGMLDAQNYQGLKKIVMVLKRGEHIKLAQFLRSPDMECKWKLMHELFMNSVNGQYIQESIYVEERP